MGVELGIGKLGSRAVDYGDSIHFWGNMKRRPNFGCSAGSNRCDSLAVAAGCEWDMRNRPNRASGMQRVGF